MFTFMKKEKSKEIKEDKERRKKEKNEKKIKKLPREANLSSEDLIRLDEVRRSFKISRKKPSNLHFPDVGPGKGILKSKVVKSIPVEMDLDNDDILLANTKQNEYLYIYKSPSKSLSSMDEEPSPSLSATSVECKGEGLGLYHKNLSFIKSSLPKMIRHESLETREIMTRNFRLFQINEGIVLIVGPLFGGSDELLFISHLSVEGYTVKELVTYISTLSEDELSFKVRPRPEFFEIVYSLVSTSYDVTQPTSKSHTRFQYNKAKSEDQLENEKVFLESERVWLVHQEGFTGAKQFKGDKSLSEGKVRIQLDYNDDILEVEDDDVEKANPSSFDRVEDLAQLRYLNESSILHTLRQRYGNSLIHTYSGPSIISINPIIPLCIYSDKVIELFKECKTEDMPPHIYSVAQTAYRSMLISRQDQSIAFIGRSGSGKSTNLKHIMNYFASVAGNSNKIVTTKKVSAILCLMEAFGNSKTILNSNASRFTQMVNLDFDTSGEIGSVSIQAMMLDNLFKPEDVKSKHNIFYQVLSGLDQKTRRELHLESLSEHNLFMNLIIKSDDKNDNEWTRTHEAMKLLAFTPLEISSILSVLAAIVHLLDAGVARGNGQIIFGRPQNAQKAAQCLGSTIEELIRIIFKTGTSSSATLNRQKQRNNFTNSPDGTNSLATFISGLYQEVFNAVVFLINRSTCNPLANTSQSIFILDTPGFQNPASCGQLRGASFEDLCSNYIQERLQLLFHHRHISSQYEKYNREQIKCEVGSLDDIGSPEQMVSLLDKQPGVRSSESDMDSTDRRGLIWLLDEEALFPGASDESFVERLLLQYTSKTGYSSNLMLKGMSEFHFVLQHFGGTNPVLYNAHGWLLHSREDISLLKSASNILIESKTLGELFSSSIRRSSSSVSGSVSGLEGSHTLRRVSSVRRGFTSGGQAGIKRHSIALQRKFIFDGLCEQLRRTRIHFIHCFLPQHTSGLSIIPTPKHKTADDIAMNIPLVRSQLRGAQIIDSIRLFKNGFPESMPFPQFWRRFHLFLTTDDERVLPEPSINEMKSAVEEIIQVVNLDASAYRLGNTQVFLKAGVLVHLENERDEMLRESIIRFQALCRGHLARNRLQKQKTQDIAIRCIQKNVKKFMGVQEWSWWKLFLKITPMLNVHRTEDELKSKTEECEALKSRLDRIENENKKYKMANELLDSRLSEMTVDLTEEHSTATLAAERLELEQSERMKLKMDNQSLNDENKRLHLTNERMEAELLYSRAAIEINGSHFEDETGNEIYKHKYDRAMKELDFAKKRIIQQHEDDLEQLMAVKKQLEKKLSDAYEEVEEQRQFVASWKRKTHKIQGEQDDLKHLLEEQNSRNALLEKKQRKFDAEIASLHEDKRSEVSAKEKCLREMESLKKIKYSLEDSLQALKLDLEFKEEKISTLSKEVEELSSNGGVSDDEVAMLKRQKNDLDFRLKDQEEELDDLAGQVQMLEQTKTKLEMSLAALKKEHRRELSFKDDELDEIRVSSLKKVKALEQQLENEHDERIKFMREKHDLETKIIHLRDVADRSTNEDQVIKLKKDVKRTKALLKDAQLMIEKTKSDSSSKILLRQLKIQLEDTEFAKTAALKARQNTEMELVDVQQQLDDVMRSKSDLEDKLMKINREKSDALLQLEDNEEELADVMRKYKGSVSQLSIDQMTILEQTQQLSELEEEKKRLKDSLHELSQKIESLENENIVNPTCNRLELKIRELETKLELEQTTRGRMETQINRLKEGIERLNSECDALRMKESSSQEENRKLQRQLRELKEDFANIQQKETEINCKKIELEKQLELSEAEILTTRNDLKLALKRIEDLQTAIHGELSSDTYNSDGDSDSSEEGMESFLDHHRRAISVQRERESLTRDLPSSRASIVRTLLPMSEVPEESSISLKSGFLEDPSESIA